MNLLKNDLIKAPWEFILGRFFQGRLLERGVKKMGVARAIIRDGRLMESGRLFKEIWLS